MGMMKRFVVGEPLATSEEQHQRLGRPTALAVFASDAISSTAYATEEILLVLVPLAGLAALTDLLPISSIVIVLLTIVITSYRQTIYAYPSGGGSYVVSRENLGETPSLVAGASLLVDYILTVAVSISAGVAAITSAFPELRPERVLLCLGFVALMMFANLRGLKESGRLFAGPTYLYMIMIIALIGVGFIRYFTGSIEALPPNTEALERAHRQRRAAHRHHGDGIPAGVLVGCRRPHRHRGDLERRARVQEARVAQRGHDVDRDGRDPRQLLPRDRRCSPTSSSRR